MQAKANEKINTLRALRASAVKKNIEIRNRVYE
jgi:hypothetical protein